MSYKKIFYYILNLGLKLAIIEKFVTNHYEFLNIINLFALIEKIFTITVNIYIC
jgi:hypothetical protein